MEKAISGPDGGVSTKHSKEIRHNHNATTVFSSDTNFNAATTNDIATVNDITTACSNAIADVTTVHVTTTMTDSITADDDNDVEGAIVNLPEECIIQLNEKWPDLLPNENESNVSCVVASNANLR